MTDGTMNSLTPDEALYAFMDGELEIPDEQRLFDALAGNPELRTEMKDILSIRSAVHRDQLFPSPSVETGILAAAGLTPAGSAVVGGAGAAAVSASAPWWEGLQSLVYTAGGLVAGALVMFSVMSTTPSDKGSDLASGGGADPP